MSVARTAAAVAILLGSWSAFAPPSAADQDALVRAKALYTSAAYDEALALLNDVSAASPAEAIEANQYRAFCLLALGRADDARKVIQEIVEANPAFQPADAQMSPRLLREYAPLGGEALTLLRAAIDQMNLSARAYDRIIKVARTIADLGGEPQIGIAHIAEAVQYRALDRKFWA